MPVSVFDASIVQGWSDAQVSGATPGVLITHTRPGHQGGNNDLVNNAHRATQRIPPSYVENGVDSFIRIIRLNAGEFLFRTAPDLSTSGDPASPAGPQFTEAAEDDLELLIRAADGTQIRFRLADLDDLDETEPYSWGAGHVTAEQVLSMRAPGCQWVLVDGSNANVDGANFQVTSVAAAIVVDGQTITGAGTLGSADLEVASPTATIITDTAVISAPAAAPDTYGLGETIIFAVTWDVPVNVTGTPRFPVNFGQSPSGGPEYADYARGDGTAVLEFEWVVAATDQDTNGVFFYGPTDSQNRGLLVGGTIRNAGTQIDADRATLNRGTQSEHKVDGSLTPPVLSVALSGQTLIGTGTLGQASLTVAGADATVVSGQTLTGTGTLGQASLTVAAAGATVVSGQTLTGSGTLGRASLTGAAAAVPLANIDPQDLARPVMALAGDRWLGGPESATQRLRDALIITRGSYPAARDYGSNLADVLDRPLQAAGQAALMAAVADAVAHRPNGLDDVRLRSVAVRTLDGVTTLDIRADWVSESGAITPIGLREQLAAR